MTASTYTSNKTRWNEAQLPELCEMATYHYHIIASKPFRDGDGMELSDSEAAWREALLFVRDIEGSLLPGQSWSLDVIEDGRAIFRISIASEDLRSATNDLRRTRW